MASFQNVGAPVTIAPGGTHYWAFWFGPGLDVGAVAVTPNIHESQINVHLVTSDLGVRTLQTPVEEGAVLIRYTGPGQNSNGDRGQSPISVDAASQRENCNLL